MPRAKILTKQAMFTLAKLHSELARKLLDNKREAKRLTVAMIQVEAVMKMLQPGYNVSPIRRPSPHSRGAPYSAAPLTFSESPAGHLRRGK